MAERVVLPDEGHVAQPELLVEILAERMTDLTRRNRGANDGRRALPLRDVVGAGRVHHERHAGLLAHLRHRRAFMTAQRPDHEMHFLLQHEAARLRQRLIRIAGRVAGDDLDLAAAGGHAGLFPEQTEAVDHFGARRCERAGDRRQEADTDRSLVLCLCERGKTGERCGSGQSRCCTRELSERKHVPSLELASICCGIRITRMWRGIADACSPRRLPP